MKAAAMASCRRRDVLVGRRKDVIGDGKKDMIVDEKKTWSWVGKSRARG
jgi:hypothetical protein